MGFSKNAPPSTKTNDVHSRASLFSRAFRPVLARGQVLFRLRGFSPPGRFAPSLIPRVCCTPLPILGFTVFRPFSRTPYDLLSIDLPRCSPFEAFSLSAAIHSLDSTSSPLPSEDGPISRFLSADQSRCVPPMFPPAEARCFLGFLPVASRFLPAVEDLAITSGLTTQGLVQHSSAPFFFNSLPGP